MRQKIAAIAVACAAVSAQAAGVWVGNGFATGSDFRQWGEAQQRSYVAGAVSGFLAASQFALTTLPRAQHLGTCLEQMHATDEQLALIVSRFIEAHPERLNESLNGLMFSSLFYACKTNGTPLD